MDERDLEDLLAEFIERRESGESLTREAFLSEHPRWGPDLAAALSELDRAEALLGSETATPQERLGPWRLIRPIGRGGTGVVFQAESVEQPGSVVALKVLSMAAGLDRRAVTRFKREGEALARLNDPRIVRVLETGESGGNLWIAMSLVDGRPLTRILEAKGDAWRELPGSGERECRVARWVAELARAVHGAHEAGLLHRDIKPSNVMLDGEGRPVLLDFGLVGDDAAATLTRTGDILGTPAYMAPEQIRGDTVDRRTDVHALGVLLFELLTGHRPWSGPDPLGVMEAIQFQPPPSVRSETPGISRGMEGLVRAALAVDPEDRPSDALAFAEDLERLASGERPRMTGPPWWRRWRPSRRQGIAMVVLMLAIAAGVLVESLGRKSSTSSRPDLSLDDALISWLDGREDEARSHIKRLLDAGNGGPEADVLMARLNGSMPPDFTGSAWEDLSVAERLRLEGHASEAIAAYLRCIQRQPQSVLPGLLLGLQALDEERLDIAERELDFAVRRIPGSGALRRLKAKVQYRREEYAASVRTLRLALENAPGDPDLLRDLARGLYMAGRFEEGLEVAWRAVDEVGKEGEKGLVVLAALLDRNQRHDEAERILRSLVTRHPKSVSYRYNLAVCLDYQHRSDETRQILEGILDEDPQHLDSLILLANLHAGANSEFCQGCRDFYRRFPQLLDARRAEEYIARAFRRLGGRVPRAQEILIRLTRRIGREEAMQRVVDEIAEKVRERYGSTSEGAKRLARLREARVALDVPRQ